MRSGPIRNWSTLYRRPDSWNAGEAPLEQTATDGERPDGSYEQVVGQGVELGYRVIEEQIRQGQRIAEQINRRSYDWGATENDIREVTERIARYYADLAALWFDFIGSMIGNRDFLRGLFGSEQPRSRSSPAAPRVSGSAAVSIEVVSARPTRVTLDLHPDSERLPLFAQDLRALEGGRPPLDDVAFERSHDGKVVSLRIRVPDWQPSGIYVGAVIDRDTGLARGTLTVRLGGQSEDGATL